MHTFPHFFLNRAETGSDKTYNHQLQIRYRALDLLAEWTDCCFQFDFKTNPGLLESLFSFLDEEVCQVEFRFYFVLLTKELVFSTIFAAQKMGKALR